jgi:hypothetical protein
MKALEQLERLKRMNELIKAQCTGTPDEFANMLNISRRQLYEYISYIKDLGVDIGYSKRLRTFYLTNDHELTVTCNIKVISKKESININGGFFLTSYQSAFFMHRTKVA